jgi:uncharacterized membrane protein YbaN (DUF454 family)
LDRTTKNDMSDASSILQLFHSIVRWLVLISVAGAGIVALKGYMRKDPIIVWERTLSIFAMVLCHVQLVLGLALYAFRFKRYDSAENWLGNQTMLGETVRRYWKFEHIGMMVIAIALVTIGRMVSKRAKTEPGKQLRIAIFYLLALVIMLYMIPWPFTSIGQNQNIRWF